jgi:hypothetical protein
MIVREQIEGVVLSRLWNRTEKKWDRFVPAKAEVVMIRGTPEAAPPGPDGPRMLDVTLPLRGLHPYCSWIGQGGANTPGQLHYFNLTLMNPQDFPVRDVVIMVRFKDDRGRPLNYEAFLTVPGPVKAGEARRFERLVPTREFGLITEGDRAASYDLVILSAAPAKPLLPK